MEDAGRGERPSSAEEAFAHLIELQGSGRAPEFEAWVQRYPEWEDELRRLNAEWQQIDAQLEEAFAGPTGPDSPFLSALAEARTAETETVEVAPLPLRAGAHIGEFTLVRPIAQGGMGQVWEAVQVSLQRRVALKLIRPDRIDAHAIELFEREARAGGRVNDPRIVTVHATGEAGGVRWIAQEYVAGERTLADFLAQTRSQSSLPPDYFRRIARFFAETAEAMAAAHAEGVVHRDLKPANILVTLDEEPKVTDFGLARLQDETSLSGPISVAGTTHYMSPEQVAGKLFGIDARTDVFSLGAVLYEALTLHRPFEGQTTAEVFSQISVREPTHPRKVRADVPAELAVIALKALEKRPRDRYADMAALAADLRRFLANEPILARPPGPLQRARKWAQRHPTATVAAAMLVVLAAVLFVGQAQARREAEKRYLATEILWDIEDGQLDQAGQNAQLLLDLDPGDPLAHLLMAQGNARFLRFTETEQCLEQAIALGFRPDDPDADSSQELYLRALYLISLHTPEALESAADHLQRAINQDEEFAHAWFPLYQVRKVKGDIDGAKKALQAYKETLRIRDKDRIHVVDALSAELYEDYATATAELEALRALVGPARMIELRGHRHLGRNYLHRFLQGGRSDSGLLEKAEDDMRAAVQALDMDASSWAGLGLVELLRIELQATPLELEDHLARAEEYARCALVHDRSATMAQEVRVDAALLRILADFDAKRPDEALLEELERRLGDLEQLAPDGETARSARAQLAYFHGAIAQENKDLARATELFEDGVDAYEHELRSRVLLAERMYLDRADYEGALSRFIEARRIWEDGIPSGRLVNRRPWAPRWGLAIHVWIFGTADRAEDPELAREARDIALEWLDAGDETDPIELLNLAEFLAIPVHDELRDCERALDIVERYDLERHFEREDRADALAILEGIRAACP